MQTLIIYSTIDGQTKRICDVIAQACLAKQETVKLVDLAQANTLDLTNYDKILIGASIRYGKHRPQLFEFIHQHQEVLRSKVNGFFSVNVVARKPQKNTPTTNPYMKKFAELSAWQPQMLAVFAGRINYPAYRFVDRFMIRFIMWLTKGPTDTSQSYEFTDWQQVAKFAEDFSLAKVS